MKGTLQVYLSPPHPAIIRNICYSTGTYKSDLLKSCELSEFLIEFQIPSFLNATSENHRNDLPDVHSDVLDTAAFFKPCERYHLNSGVYNGIFRAFLSADSFFLAATVMGKLM